MKKVTLFLAIFITALFLAACGSGGNESADNEPDSAQKDAISEGNTATEEESETKDDTGENPAANGDAEVLQLLENNEIGEYLADSKGMTLYYFKNDEPEKSNCSGECLDNWPAFLANDVDVPDGFDKNDFGTITREDTNAEQVTYKGYPLYYFAKDQQEGDVNGQGVKDVWYIINKDTEFEK